MVVFQNSGTANNPLLVSPEKNGFKTYFPINLPAELTNPDL